MDPELETILDSKSPSSESPEPDFEQSMTAFDEEQVADKVSTGADKTESTQLGPNQILINGKKFTIDERFAKEGTDIVTAVHNQIQSEKDKILNNYNLLNEKTTVLEQSDSFLNLLQKDPQVLKAFVKKIQPDLIPATDVKTYLQKKIAEKYGEDFQYDPEAAKDPTSDHFDYYDDVRQWKKEAKESGELPETFESIMEAKTKEAEALNAKKLEIKNQIIKEMNSSEEEYNGMSKWAGFLAQNPKQLMKMYRFAMRKTNKTNSLVNSNGGPVDKTIEQALSDLLGH